MPSTWFQGGISNVIQSVDYMLDTVVIRAALVAGNGVTVDPDWITLDQFLAQNTLLSDNAGNIDVVTGATASSQGWSPGDQRFNFGINEVIDFNVVNALTAIGGVVFYAEAASTDPTNAILLGAQDSPETGAGGIVTWGSATNTVGYWKPKVIVSGTTAFQGTIDRLVNLGDGTDSTWADVLMDVAFALVRSTNSYNPVGNETTIASITPQVTWCTNGDPASAIASGAFLPLTGAGERVEAWTTGTDSFDLIRQSELSGGKEIKFPQTGGAGGALTPGEIVVGVISFIYPTGVYSDATAWLLNWDFIASKTITGGQDLIYGATATNIVTETIVQAQVV